jgi:hypothetical protein
MVNSNGRELDRRRLSRCFIAKQLLFANIGAAFPLRDECAQHRAAVPTRSNSGGVNQGVKVSNVCVYCIR